MSLTVKIKKFEAKAATMAKGADEALYLDTAPSAGEDLYVDTSPSTGEDLYSDVVADGHNPTGGEGDDAYMTVGSTE